jgi:uncharacterized protein (DUF1330 family)
MPKGYWIAHVDVHDPEIYQQYVKANAVAFAKFGRNVVIEFRDYETALACHDSEEYRAAAKLRDAAAAVDLVIAEGYDGPQPG